MKRLIASVSMLFVLALSDRAFAQARWVRPYEEGVKAFNSAAWQKAVASLEAAIRIDPKQNAHKPTDGVFTDPYFPYYYLGVAYLRLGDNEKASRNFAEAIRQGGMSGAMTDEIRKYQADLAPKPPPRAQGPANAPTPTGPRGGAAPGGTPAGGTAPTAPPSSSPTSGTVPSPPAAGPPAGGNPAGGTTTGAPSGGSPGTGTGAALAGPPSNSPRGGTPPPPAPPAPTIDPRFVQLADQARTELEQRRFQLALDQFDALRSAFPA